MDHPSTPKVQHLGDVLFQLDPNLRAKPLLRGDHDMVATWRAQMASLGDIQWAILEGDGHISFIPRRR
jgi:hypothetical protein